MKDGRSRNVGQCYDVLAMFGSSMFRRVPPLSLGFLLCTVGLGLLHGLGPYKRASYSLHCTSLFLSSLRNVLYSSCLLIHRVPLEHPSENLELEPSCPRTLLVSSRSPSPSPVRSLESCPLRALLVPSLRRYTTLRPHYSTERNGSPDRSPRGCLRPCGIHPDQLTTLLRCITCHHLHQPDGTTSSAGNPSPECDCRT